jgi:hypothetical protein
MPNPQWLIYGFKNNVLIFIIILGIDLNSCNMVIFSLVMHTINKIKHINETFISINIHFLDHVIFN